jgi:hypothetical protein
VPLLHLAVGNVTRYAYYTSGSASKNLVFTYTVVAGDSSLDLDTLSATSFLLNQGAIQSPQGVAAKLTLPTPGALGSLSHSKDIAIDGVLAQVLGQQC